MKRSRRRSPGFLTLPIVAALLLAPADADAGRMELRSGTAERPVLAVSVRVEPDTVRAGGADLQEAVERARQTLDSMARAAGGAGLQAAVARGDRVLWTEGFGLADAASERPVTEGTRFRLYSLSKPMTAVAAARLMEAGRLDPAAPVQDYVPSFPEKAGTVTPMHLLRHTSGLRHYRDEAEARNLRHCETVADALPIFAQDPLLHPPGVRETYSTWGYVLLSAVIEAVVDRPYAAHVREELLAPAGLRRTVIDDPTREIPGRATFYHLPPAGETASTSAAPHTRLEPAKAVDNTCKWGGGAWLSTAADVARFFGAVARGEILAPATVRRLTGGEATYEGMGLGAGGMAFLRADLETGLILVVLSNTTGEDLGPRVQRAVSTLYRLFREAGDSG